MDLFNNKIYQEDIETIANWNFSWDKLKNRQILITGATGLFGTFLVDVLIYKNRQDNLNCKIIGTGRSKAKGEEHFKRYNSDNNFEFIEYDLNNTSTEPTGENCHPDQIVHLASNTHPQAYATDPIGTVTANVIGTYNLLNFAAKIGAQRFVYASTCEIYGENRGDAEKFDELYCGYIDSNTLRAGYPESKRCGEALCQAFKSQKDIDIVIPRFARSYGPTLKKDDSKAMSQFLHNALNHEDIVLKSDGEQYFSYIYAADAVGGLLAVMLDGKSGEAYNISDEKSDIKLKDLAKIIADYGDVEVKFELPDEVEKSGFSKVTKARLDPTKIKTELGWSAQYDIHTGIKRTLEVLKEG